ncbi:MAG: hypothetical protein NWF10_08135, partial [Candidatus Bathyarchaeota archaeon]|nr:hypothetical protein [Candidatus Bathyarchaeota archaeon]
SKQYPQNFVCMLPKNIKLKVKPSNIFEKVFGKDSIEIAKQLLKKALRSRADPETTKAIRYRLKLLEPIPKNLVKCNMCGKDFQARRYRYGRQKTCHECKTKRYADKTK